MSGLARAGIGRKRPRVVIDKRSAPVNAMRMDQDEFAPRLKQNALADLQRQDLDPLSVDELKERIALLETEIARTRMRLSRSTGDRASAEALFRKP